MNWTITMMPHMQEAIDAMPPSVTKGRNLKDGYVRGCGIYGGNILDLCGRDPVFKSAYQAARKRTMLPDVKLASLYFLIRFNLAGLPAGNIVEFGAYRGGSAIFMAIVAKAFRPSLGIFAFDTFEGMPPIKRNNDVYGPGCFTDVDFDELRSVASNLGLDNLTFVKGEFGSTLPKTLPDVGPISLSHIDCDLYESVSFAYDACKSHYVPGCYLVFDDPLEPSCIEAFEAIEDFVIKRDGLHAEQVFPHMIYRYGLR